MAWLLSGRRRGLSRPGDDTGTGRVGQPDDAAATAPLIVSRAVRPVRKLPPGSGAGKNSQALWTPAVRPRISIRGAPTMSDPAANDDELLRRAPDGDEPALAALFD